MRCIQYKTNNYTLDLLITQYRIPLNNKEVTNKAFDMFKAHQMHFGFMDVILLHSIHQHVSVTHVAIFRAARTKIQMQQNSAYLEADYPERQLSGSEGPFG